MITSPVLKDARNLSSADYLAERVRNAYQTLGSNKLSDALAAVESLYSEDICFEDPSHAVQGRTELMDYFHKMFSGLGKCDFRFHRTISNDTEIFLSWTMIFSHSRLRNGETLRVEGASYLKTRNGRIYYHRDYFDMGAMLYEHLPLIGRILRRLKQGLGQ